MLPKSTLAPFLVAFVGFLGYFALTRGALPTDAYIGFAIDVFNIVAIVGIVVILYRKENSDPQKFGVAIRDNISTFFVALLVNLILGIANIWEKISAAT